MEEIIADAKALGKKIAAHPRTTAFMTAAKAVSDDRDAQNLLKAYQEQVERIHTLEAQGKPVEPDEKRKLVDREADLAGNARLKEMMKAQTDYMELMHRINSAIDEASASAAAGPAGA